MERVYENLATLMEMIAAKPAVDEFAKTMIINPKLIPVLMDIIKSNKGSAKFYCEKVIRRISEKNPLLLYPYFEDISDLIDSPNSFIKWGAIITVSNLVAVDDEKKMEHIYEKYMSLINDNSMITAANTTENVWKIVLKYPQHEGDITKRLIRVTDNVYFNKGQPSPECQIILCGHVLDCFERYFEQSAYKEKMLEFALNLTDSSRHAVAKKAQVFLKKHVI